MGIQDSALGVLEEKIISAGGFSRHPKDVVKKNPDAFGGHPDGFTNLTFLFDPRKPDDGWTRIADAPGPPRQAAATAVADSDLYMIGGFSYSEPRSYTFTYRLRSEGGHPHGFCHVRDVDSCFRDSVHQIMTLRVTRAAVYSTARTMTPTQKLVCLPHPASIRSISSSEVLAPSVLIRNAGNAPVPTDAPAVFHRDHFTEVLLVMGK
jgi:hypothetical protein